MRPSRRTSACNRPLATLVAADGDSVQQTAGDPVQREAHPLPVRGATAIGSLVSLLVFAGCAGRTVSVPNVMGQPRAAAEAALRDEGLEMSAVVKAHMPLDRAPCERLVTRQVPEAGARVRDGSVVSVELDCEESSAPSASL